MSKIIFKRLTVKEEEKVTAGDSSSDINTPSASNRTDCSNPDYTVGNGCILEAISQNDYLSCDVSDNDLNCTIYINDK